MDAITEDMRLPTAIDAQPVVRAAAAMRPKLRDYKHQVYCADRNRWLGDFEAAIAPLELTLSEQSYVAGASPGYADYVLFSVFQYARLGSPLETLRPETAVRHWRDRLAGSFDCLGDRFPAYPAKKDGSDGR
jgi:glutathione S-transferase